MSPTTTVPKVLAAEAGRTAGGLTMADVMAVEEAVGAGGAEEAVAEAEGQGGS
jgi:hypothetical protein